jgi:hypothetical protein
MDYQYDVFLSYRRGAPVGDWVNNHFYREVMNWLPLEMNRPVTAFKDDKDIALGNHWPETIKQALGLSRCLLCVWSPDYFWHEWCVAEWKTMAERQRLAGYATPTNPSGLIVPVVFHDGVNFPQEAQNAQSKDFSNYNYQVVAFSQTALYLQFIDEVK